MKLLITFILPLVSFCSSFNWSDNNSQSSENDSQQKQSDTIVGVQIVPVEQESDVINIEATRNYQISNEKGQLLDAMIFINKKMFSGKATKELIIYFKTLPEPFVVLIAIPPKLIGIPERYSTMKISKNVLYLRKESLIFTPVNVGIEKMIDNWSIEDDIITFDTFERISFFGKRIVIKKLKVPI